MKRLPTASPRKALGLIGAPYGQYLLDDVLAGRCPAKLLVVVVSQALLPERRAALERTAKGKAVDFIDENGVSTEALRTTARAVGLHLYTNTDAVVFANGPLVAVHAVKDGLVTVTPKRGGKAVTLSLKKGETQLLTR
jgi:hypothetical protein